jgi:hypothetical protein
MIDLRTEELIPLAELPQHWPLLPGGRRLHRSVGYRYAKVGVGPGRVKLETVVVGSVRYTSLEAIQRFAERLTEAEDGVEAGGRVESKARRGRRASRVLDEAGI